MAVFVTGIVLFITPPGRIANWTNWTFWNLTKHQWINLHICFTLVFVLVCVAHLWLNFKPFMNYFSRKVAAVRKMRWEPVFALVLCVIIFAGALKPFAPFNILLDLNQHLKFSWDSSAETPPIPNAELLTVAELADQTDLDIKTVLANLKAGQIEASRDDLFGVVAEKNSLTSNELYTIATGMQSSAGSGRHHSGGGRVGQGGFGQRTLKEACQTYGINESDAIDGFEKDGIKASSGKTIREIADENAVHPSQIRQILENQ